MARAKKRVPPVIAKILKAVDDLSPAEAAEALQDAAADESSVENRILLLQARIKLLQDSQKPKRPPRKRKPKPKGTKAEEPAKETPKKEEAKGKVTAIDLDNLGALFGAVESGAAQAEKATEPAEAAPKPSGGIDFGEMDALLAIDDDDGDSDATVEATPSDETDPPPPGSSDKSDGAIQMPDLSALNDLGGTDDAAEADDDGSDELSALMTSMSMNSPSGKPKADKAPPPATGEDDPSEKGDLPDLSALDALDDAPEEDTSGQDDLSALMGALSDDAAETGETDEEEEAPVAGNAPEPADPDALDDAPEEDTSDQDDLAALMDALSDDAAETGETDEEDEAPVADNAPEPADPDALDDAPEEDTSDQDDLAALMDALSDDAAETGETDEEDEAPDADNAPGSADSDALDDAPDEIGDDVSELMVALVDDDDTDMAPVPQAETAPDEGTSMASMSAPTGSDEGATVEDFTGQEESNSGNIMDLSPMLSALSDLDDPAVSPEAAQIDMPTDDDSEADAAAGTKDEDTPPPPEPVAPEDHTGDTDTPDYSEFEALMGAAAQQMAPEENTAPSEEPEVAQDPALETSEPQSPPDAQAAGTAPATAQPEASEEPDFSEFNALMAAADNGAGDIGGVDDGAHDAEIAPAPEAVTAQADRPEIDTDMGRSSEPAMPETLDATAGDDAQETSKPTAPLPESDAAVPTEDSTAVTGRSEVQQPDVVDEVPAPQTAAHVPEATEPQPTAAEPVAASFAEGKKKATLDDLYRLFPKREP